MQHDRAALLRDQARDERPDGAAGAPRRGHEADGRGLDGARQQAHERDGGAGRDGAQHVANEADGDGVADHVGHQPDQQLEGYGAEAEDEDEAPLADAGGDVGQGEAAEGDSCLRGPC